AGLLLPLALLQQFGQVVGRVGEQAHVLLEVVLHPALRDVLRQRALADRLARLAHGRGELGGELRHALLVPAHRLAHRLLLGGGDGREGEREREREAGSGAARADEGSGHGAWILPSGAARRHRAVESLTPIAAAPRGIRPRRPARTAPILAPVSGPGRRGRRRGTARSRARSATTPR